MKSTRDSSALIARQSLPAGLDLRSRPILLASVLASLALVALASGACGSDNPGHDHDAGGHYYFDAGPDDVRDSSPDDDTDAGRPPPDSGPHDNANSPLGTNLSPINDWSSEWAFVDIFKMSRTWTSGSTTGTWDDGRSIAVDPDGWVTALLPNQIARSLMLVDLANGYPTGRYLVLYDGEGTINYDGGASLVGAESAPGRHVLEVNADGGILLNLTATNAANPVRNIRILMPGGVCSNDEFRACDSSSPCDGGSCESFENTYQTSIFHPTFLASIKNYRVLRFMDWMDTNDSVQQSFADRPRLADARWTTHGVPAEIMVDLSNRLGADPWFTLPHLANDDYVSRFADLVRDNLEQQRTVYVEYSNEVWNAIFDQSGYAESEGNRLGLVVSGDPYSPRRLYYSQRSVEIFKIFESSFAGTERLQRVIAWQVGNAYGAEQILAHADAEANTDALAIAPYFGHALGAPENVASTETMTVDEAMSFLEQTSVPQAITQIRDSGAVATASNLHLLSYEAGQHLTGVGGVENNAAINTLMDQLNRDPRMGDRYTQLLNGWRSAGGQTMVHFNNCASQSKWGRWGALENLMQLGAGSPKYDALQQFIRDNPLWW